MIERQIKTEAGRFSVCRCGCEPRQILILGTSASEQLGKKYPLGISQRWKLVCRCGRTTAKHASLLEAETEWGPLLSQRPLGLPAAVAQINGRTRVRKEVRHG